MPGVPPLVIRLNDDGNVAVEGPIDNKLIALGLLEVAKDAIIKHHDKQTSERRIIPATGMTLVPPKN